MKQIADLKIPVIAGIWPLASYRNAQFMKNQVPGVTVPNSIMERMGAVESREEQAAVGIEIAREAIAEVREKVQGVQVSAPFGNIDSALAVLEG
jgi:homocysteine S-methyltransferase